MRVELQRAFDELAAAKTNDAQVKNWLADLTTTEMEAAEDACTRLGNILGQMQEGDR